MFSLADKTPPSILPSQDPFSASSPGCCSTRSDSRRSTYPSWCSHFCFRHGPGHLNLLLLITPAMPCPLYTQSPCVRAEKYIIYQTFFMICRFSGSIILKTTYLQKASASASASVCSEYRFLTARREFSPSYAASSRTLMNNLLPNRGSQGRFTRSVCWSQLSCTGKTM